VTGDLRDLRWAIIAAQHRSLRQAAETLNIRQSTLSRSLRDLEYRLGAALFERTNGGTRTTVAGQEFIETARHIVEEMDAAFARAKTRSRGESGQLTVGVYASPAAGNMHATIVEHHRRFPNVNVRTVDGTHDRLLRALTENVIDIAVMTTCPAGWDDRMLPLWCERVVVALPEFHSLCGHDVVFWPDLSDERVLLPQNGPGAELGRLLVAKLHDSAPQHVLYQDAALDRLLSLVSAGHGILLMLEGGTGVRHDGVTYRGISDDRGPSKLNFMAYWREANSNPTLGPFLAMLRERYPDLSATPPPD
jgi:DNA-binding transcriptional LysR family regulator